MRAPVIDIRAAGAARARATAAHAQATADPVQGREMLETLAIIDSAALSLSAPLLTSGDLASARNADRAAQSCLLSRDAAGTAWWNAVFHQALTSRCPNLRISELLAGELALVQSVIRPRTTDWAGLARAAREHATMLRLAQSCPRSSELPQLARAHWRTCC